MEGPVTEDQVLRLWGDLIKNPDIHWPQTPLLGALDVFSDATKAFAANATLGAAILCRAAIDGACLIYLVYSKRNDTGTQWSLTFPLGLDGKMRDVLWSELKGGIKQSGIFSDGELGNLERIREHGNIAAHLMERHLKWIHSLTHSVAAGREEAKNPWMLPMETWKDLQDTAKILERLCMAVYSKGTSESPPPGSS